MGLVTGIKGFQAASAQRDNSDFVKWLLLKDGQTVKGRFLSELDPDSSQFDPKRGLAVMAIEHQAPFNFRLKAQCSMEDEGKCWACEQAQVEKKWKAKQRFYANVVVDNGIDDPYVAVWHMSPWKNTAYETFMDHYIDNGSISDYTFKLKRKGSGQNDTTYIFSMGPQDTTPFDWSGFEPFDLSRAIPAIPYAEQAAFFGAGAVTVTKASDASQSDELVW